MFNERAFIAQVEAAGPDEFGRIMARPDRDQETALRRHFGDERYRRMHEMAARRAVRSAEKLGNVVVIHGIMGGELTAVDRKGGGDRVWVHFLRLLNGAFERLRLDESGEAPADPRWDVRASGIYKKDYGEQLLFLSQQWNVRAFWYDWRQDLHKAAALLHTQINGWFGVEAPVHLVAHSMGGLVARTFIADYPDRWRTMQDPDADRGRGGRLLMLGTPNHGSFAVPQILTGLEGIVRKLAAADLRHSVVEIREIVQSFPGSYQMLPSPLVLPEMEPLYQAHTYGAALRVPQRHLDAGRRFHEKLKAVVEPARMVYVAGYNQPTLVDVDVARVGERSAYQVTLEGDGRVPHILGRLDGVRTYYVEEGHGSLPGNGLVLDATTELLRMGESQVAGLLQTMPQLSPNTRATATTHVPGAEEWEVEEVRLRAERLQRLRGAEETAPISEDERVAATLLLDGWLGRTEEDDDRTALAPGAAQTPSGLTNSLATAPTVNSLSSKAGGTGASSSATPAANVPDGATVDPAPISTLPRRTVRVRVVKGDIGAEPDQARIAADAIAVGHYIGVRPQYAEKALDEAISRVLCGLPEGAAIAEERLLLTQYTERGTIRGELGQPFLLPDPRKTDRLLVIAGMGFPGRFGVPELTVLARELAWTLDRLGRRHLATVLIGSGAGNLPTREAVAAWVGGLREALAGGEDANAPTVECVTFIERDARRAIEIDAALKREDQRYEDSAGEEPNRFDLEHEPLDDATRDALIEEAVRQARERAEREIRQGADEARATEEPTRVTVTLERREKRSVYRIGAITGGASVPEREVVLDEQLVTEANDHLPGLRSLHEQRGKGRFLEQLLLSEMRDALSTSAPLVLVLDATTARIHWEMLAQPGARTGSGAPPRPGDFLGTSRRLTRQLRTTFAPVPEPPPPAQRPLRALIVTDPAGDAPLPGASLEGMQIASLFGRFNALRPHSPRRVEVVHLSGPAQATRHAVLDALLDAEPFDILHFAGHCVFDREDPATSGWIFQDGRRISANELRRVDRIPKFVFSNACESGITPDRADRRTAELAPSFAEAFFERGVANFVCTAWPIGDEPARDFALRLYAGLLGLGTPEDPMAATLRAPATMQDAMFDARAELQGRGTRAAREADVCFWGAYQHYGSPSFRLFHERELQPRRGSGSEAATGNVQ